MVCGIPLEGPRATVARDVAIQVVTERSVRTAGLAHDLIHIVGRRSRGDSADQL